MAACSAGCKEEFKRSNFLLDFPSPQYFVTSQWNNCACTTVFYLVYRILMLCGLGTIIILSGVAYVRYDPGYLWFTFMTNFSFLILTVSSLLECILVIDGFVRYRKSGGMWDKVYPSMPWYLKMSWVFTNVASCSAFIVTLLFYVTLYKPGTFNQFSFNVHAINSIYVFVNAFITATPVRIYHVFHTIIYSTLYVAFTVIYQLVLGQEPIYSSVDWRDPVNTLGFAFVLSILAPIGAWLFYYAIYRLRLAIYNGMINGCDPQARGSDKNGFVSTVDCIYDTDEVCKRDDSHINQGYVIDDVNNVKSQTLPDDPKYVSKIMVQA